MKIFTFKQSLIRVLLAIGLLGSSSLIFASIASAQTGDGTNLFIPFMTTGGSQGTQDAADASSVSLEDLVEVQEMNAEQGISPDGSSTIGDDELVALGAYGVEYWNALNTSILGIPLYIPGGQLAHLIEGNGNRIETDGANYGSAGNLCDPSIRFTYGNGKYEYKSDVRWGCHHAQQWKYRFNWDAPRGNACAELWSKNWGKKVATQCHYIHGQASIPTPTPKPSSSGICSTRPTLKYGDGFTSWGLAWKQSNVKQLQRRLTAKGFYVTADGYFGNGTKSVVQRFQRSRGLDADGIVGGNTWSRLCQ